jgi:hypothetical protein
MSRSSTALTGVPLYVEQQLTQFYFVVGNNCAQLYTASKLGFLGAFLGGSPQGCALLSLYGASDKCCGPKAPPPVAPVAPPPVAPIKPMMMMSKCYYHGGERDRLTPLTCFVS